jgi:hypothetical protein
MKPAGEVIGLWTAPAWSPMHIQAQKASRRMNKVFCIVSIYAQLVLLEVGLLGSPVLRVAA